MSEFEKIVLSFRQHLPLSLFEIIYGFFKSYERVLLLHGKDPSETIHKIEKMLECIVEQVKDPFKFAPYHEAVRMPFDYLKFGNDFIRPLIRIEESTIGSNENLKIIEDFLARGENVILLANHQIEADPQAIRIGLELTGHAFGREMIFVAGERVVTDPLAIPFSMGCNLLCIYSKRYIDNPPEDQAGKMQHNKKTMQLMSELLSEGGKCIYVAPSGGRDRKGESGKVEVAPFDPNSIEMFHLMAKRAKKPTHFFPLSLATYSVLPPPETIQTELGEARTTKGGAIHLYFGDEIEMENFPTKVENDRLANRINRAEHIHQIVRENYEKFPILY